jgi:hypothetical protein
LVAILQSSCTDARPKNAAISDHAFDSKKNIFISPNLSILAPSELLKTRHAIFVDGYCVDFDRNEIINTYAHHDSIFDSHGFEAGLTLVFDSSDYLEYSKTIDNYRHAVIFRRSVPLRNSDFREIYPAVKYLWETEKVFEHPGADGGSELWLKDGADYKRFVSAGGFYQNEEPKILLDIIKQAFQDNIGAAKR